MSKNFNEKSFTLFTINYIVGFGFITTITSLVQLNLFGIIAIIATAFITLGAALVFSRLTNNYKDEYGGSYAYTKKLNNNNFSFFVGWNQYIQGPILASTSPLFLATAASYLTSDNTTLWIIRVVSIVLFLILVLVTTFGLKLNKYVILASGIVKWTILLVALVITIYFAIAQTKTASGAATTNVTPYLIFSNIISFMYAFGGMEDVSTMAKDVKFKNFRKILMIAFAFIISFYFIFYIALIFLGNSLVIGGKVVSLQNFSQIFQIAFGATGIWLFIVGLFFNGVSTKISVNISMSRKVVPLATDGYLFHSLTKMNKKNEFKNAIWFNAGITMLSMVIFWLIPLLLNLENFFSSVIELGSVAFLLQYFLTFIVALVLEKRKAISKIPMWEKIIYYIAMIVIAASLLVYLFPFIVAEKWTVQNTIILVSYIVFILIGYVFKWIAAYNQKKHPQSTQDQLETTINEEDEQQQSLISEESQLIINKTNKKRHSKQVSLEIESES